MRKFFKSLFVQRPEIENKWWHRLSIVILFGSTGIVFLCAILLTVSDNDNHTWVSYEPIVFSLEPNYEKVRGVELPCHMDLFAFPIAEGESLTSGSGIKCDHIILSRFDSKKYLGLYDNEENKLEIQFGLNQYKISDCPNDVSKEEKYYCWNEKISAREHDPNYIKYQKALKEIAYIKATRNIDFKIVFTDIGIWFGIPLLVAFCWFIFWNSIVYRSILYIIFGNKK